MNGRSSTAQSAVITLLVGTWQVILGLFKRNNTVPGLLIKRLRPSSCIESNKRTHFIEVLATEAFNKSTFYCAAYERHQESCSCGTGGRCYSRPALLTGEQCVFVRFTFYQSNPQTTIYYCLPAVIIIDMTLKYRDYIFYPHRIITYAVRNGTYCFSSITNNWDTRNNSSSFFYITNFTRYPNA